MILELMKRNFSRHTASFLLVVAVAVQALGQAAATAETWSAAEKAIADGITAASIKDATTALAAPEMQGRGTMQPGGDKAANWIAERFQKLGLKPLGDKGSYLQKIEFKETLATADTMFKVGNETLAHGVDFSLVPQNSGNVEVSGDMLFIAFGMVTEAPARNDLAGIDVKGKVVVMLDGPPTSIGKKAWDGQDASSIFRSYVARKGAAALVYIGHGREDNPPEMLIDHFKRRQISLPPQRDPATVGPPTIFVAASAAPKLFAQSGVTFQEALQRAEENTFKPIDLKQKAKLTAKYKTVKGHSSNVAGYIEGSDPKLKEEAILFSAHYDAYGMDDGKIYPGAADNALGTAEMLAVAESYSKMSEKPKRSMIFLAVTGEEYGLFGSRHWAKTPTWNIKKVAANLNLDGIGSEVYGPVKTIVGYGAEHSSLGAMMDNVAQAMQIATIADPFPEEKIFYRSDHYSFVERGVPSLMLMGAPAGAQETWMKRIKDWQKTGDYHREGDVVKSDWAWEGAEAVAEVMGIMGWRISQSESMPTWLATSRFAKLERGNTKELPEEKK